MSVSILPYKSKLNNNSTSILSAFLVAPYVSSEVDVNLFFNSNVSVLEKDIILKTQILKRVKNKSLKFNIKPVYANENGLVIKGRVNTSLRSLKGFKVLLSSQENGILLTTHIKEGKSFEFNKLKLKKKSNYKLALLNAKGKLVKAGFYIYGDDVYKVDSLLVHSSQKNKIIDKKIIANLNINAYLIIDKTAEVLDEVIIKGKRTKGKVGNEVHPNNPKELGNGFAKNIEIRERDRMNNTVIEFLNNQLGVSASESTLGASVVIQRAAFNSITGDNQALIIFNGVQTNADILSGMRLHDVKNIKINALGAGYGVHGGSGVVVIDLKEGIEDRVTIPSNKYFLSSTDFGFSSSKPVYEAFNSVFSSKLSRSYFETLDWIPNVNLHPNSTQLLQVYKGTHQKIKLFINGMSDHGQLVYKVVEIPLK